MQTSATRRYAHTYGDGQDGQSPLTHVFPPSSAFPSNRMRVPTRPQKERQRKAKRKKEKKKSRFVGDSVLLPPLYNIYRRQIYDAITISASVSVSAPVPVFYRRSDRTPSNHPFRFSYEVPQWGVGRTEFSVLHSIPAAMACGCRAEHSTPRNWSTASVSGRNPFFFERERESPMPAS